MISILPKNVELSQECVLANFKYQDPEFYARLFDNSKEGPFEVHTGRIKVCVIKKEYLVLLSCMFFSKERVLECYINFHLNFSLLVKIC